MSEILSTYSFEFRNNCKIDYFVEIIQIFRSGFQFIYIFI